MKKEKYFEPELEITKFMSEDIITASGTETDERTDDQSLEDNNYPIFNVHD